MSFIIPLIQRDENVLEDTKEELVEQNSQLEESNTTALTSINKLILKDLPFKKQVDQVHEDIYEFERELKYLTGLSLQQPLQEDCFTISDPAANSTLKIYDGRFRIEHNGAEYLDVPIVPFRGYSLSTPCGTNFDIWSRDRHGSSTSKVLLTNIFDVDLTNENFKLTINNETQEIKLSELITLPQTLAGETLASTIQGILNNIDILETINTLEPPYGILEGESFKITIDNVVTTKVFSKATKTSIISENAESFSLRDGDSIQFIKNETNTITVSFISEEYAYTENTLPIYNLREESTLLLSVDGQQQQTATFHKEDFVDMSAATPEEVVAVLNRDWIGVTAEVVDKDPDPESVVESGRIRITHNQQGGTHYFQIFDGFKSPNLILGFSPDVVTINPVMVFTAQELCDKLNISISSIGLNALPTIDGNITIECDVIGYYNFQLLEVSGTPLSTIGFNEDVNGMLSISEVISVLDPINGIDIESVEDDTRIKISLKDTFNKFQVTNNTLNLRLGFSTHLILRESGFRECGILFNSQLLVFTVFSGTGGPNSTVSIDNSTDLANDMGFDIPFEIDGKYANNLLNVKIDDTTAEIKIGDFRKCEIDTSLGENNDDYGTQWSGSGIHLGYLGTTKVGPLFCSGINNGKDVAKSIQAQLRLAGFTDSTCEYFSREQVFCIYSGTYGLNSEVEVLAASDSNRDVRTLLGFNPPQEEKGKEQYYPTVQALTNYLITEGLSISNIIDGNRICYSFLLLRESGININSLWQSYNVPSTLIYDYGSRGWPRLYPNGKIKIDSSNCKLSFCETSNVEVIASIDYGEYVTGELADAIADAMNSTSQLGRTYSVIFKSRWKKFEFSCAQTFKLLTVSGKDSINSILYYIGFNQTTDTDFLNYIYSDRQVDFSNSDYFNPAWRPTLSATPEFYGEPLKVNKSVDEFSAKLLEKSYLVNDEEYITNIENLVLYDNEVFLVAWKELILKEIAKCEQEQIALLNQRGAFSNHKDDVGTAPQNPLDEIEEELNGAFGVLTNLNNLRYLRDNGLLSLQLKSQAFSSFTNAGSEVLILDALATNKIYNNPIPLVRFGTSKHIAGSYSPSGLYQQIVNFIPEKLPAISVTNSRVGTEGYTYSAANAGNYVIPGDLPAVYQNTILSPFNLEPNDDLKLKVNSLVEQSVTFTATVANPIQGSTITSRFVIKAGVNDHLDYYDGTSNNTIILTPGNYSGQGLATEINNQLDITQTDYIVNYGTVPNRFTITSYLSDFSLLFNSGVNKSKSVAYTIGFNDTTDKTGSLSYTSENDCIFVVVTNVNDKFSLEVNSVISGILTFPQGRYTAAQIVSQLQSIINSTFSPSNALVEYTVSDAFKFSVFRRGNTSSIGVHQGINDDFLVMIGFSATTTSDGTGNVGNIDVVTVNELVTLFTSGFTGMTFLNNSGYLKMTSVLTGSIASIQITGGSARTILGFALGTNYGDDGKDLLKVDIDGDDSQEPIVITQNTYAGNAIALEIQTKLNLIYSDVLCTYNESAVWQNFTNMLRIVSGTVGSGSSVFVSDKTIKIESGVNDGIDFKEVADSTIYTAIITPGFYNGTDLATEIQTRMNEAILPSLPVITVSFNSITDKMTISFPVLSNLLFASGPSSSNSICNVLGFFALDKMNALSFVSDGKVKTRNAAPILKFDTQTQENGHDVTSCRLTKTNTNLTAYLYWSTGNRKDMDIVLNGTMTIPDLLALINVNEHYIANVSRAMLMSRIPNYYMLENDDELLLEVDVVDQYSVVFACTVGTLESGTRPFTRLLSATSEILISLNGSTSYPIEIGMQLTSEEIAEKIQLEVRKQAPTDIKLRAAFLGFTCVHNGLKYVLTSGTQGTGSSVLVSTSGTDTTAENLKLTSGEGAIATAGTGDFVNNKFVTPLEVKTKIDSVIAYVADASTNHLKLYSTNEGVDSSIKVLSCTAKNKLGFEDNDENDTSNEIIDCEVITMPNFGNEEILDPVVYEAKRAWRTDKGNVTINYSTINYSEINTRQTIFSGRDSKIDSRIIEIEARENYLINTELTDTLYESRIPPVQQRLNKRTGSYVKIGNKYNEIDQNNQLIAANQVQIDYIDDLLI